jgi:hypothetical protein
MIKNLLAPCIIVPVADFSSGMFTASKDWKKDSSLVKFNKVHIPFLVQENKV